MQKFKKCIKIERNMTDIFSLPCVIEVQKQVNGMPLYIIASVNNDRNIDDVAETGDWLCQDNNDHWQVVSDQEYMTISNQ